MSTLLADLSMALDFDSDDLNSMLLRSDRTPLIKDEVTRSLAKISGQEIPVFTTLREARLSRASLLWNDRSPTNQYFSLTTTIKPCNIELEVELDGDRISLQELLRAIINGSKPVEKQISKPAFASLLAARSYLQSTMVMVTQHNGLSKAKAEVLFELMKANGADEALESIKPEKRNNIQRVVDFGKAPGLEILGMTLGSVDRTISQNGRGFESLVSAQIENFQRILTQHAVRHKLEQELAADRAKLSKDEIADRQLRISFFRKAGSTWANNWGGVQEILRLPEGMDEGGPADREPTGEYSPVNVPCGDFTVYDNDTEDEVAVSLWTPKDEAKAELSDGRTYEDLMDDDEPF